MKIGIDMGHTLTGVGTGAIGIVKETDKNREVGNRLISMLTENGHKVINCTIDKSNNDLVDRVNIANKQKLDLFISLHLNCFGQEKANGLETLIYKKGGQAEIYAKKIQAELLKTINWANRGVKEQNVYVCRKTSAPAILIELGFCSNKKDMQIWDTEKISRAIFKGITGDNYVSNKNLTENIGKYIVTTYLPYGYKGQGPKEEGLDLEYILSYFGGVRTYLKYDEKGHWIETQYLNNEKLEELKKSLGSWVYLIK